jgi:hypothetical protein
MKGGTATLTLDAIPQIRRRQQVFERRKFEGDFLLADKHSAVSNRPASAMLSATPLTAIPSLITPLHRAFQLPLFFHFTT